MSKKVSEENRKLNTQAQELLSKLSTDTISYTKKDYQKTARNVAEGSMSAGSTTQTHADKKGR